MQRKNIMSSNKLSVKTAFVVCSAVLSARATVIDLTAEARAVGATAYEAYSSTTQGNYNARHAFDGDCNVAAANQWRSKQTAGLPQTLTYHFTDAFHSGKKVRLVSYAIYYWNHGAWAGGPNKHIPTAWTLEASTDGEVWQPIDSRSSVAWADGAWKFFHSLQPVAYRYYRFTFTAVLNTVEDSQFVVIPELRLYGELLDSDRELAKTRFWTGGTTGFWSDAANWSEGPSGPSVPADSERVFIGNVASATTVTIAESSAKLSELQVGGLGFTSTLCLTNWNTCVSADTVTVGDTGVLTCKGDFKKEEDACRVWVKCGDFILKKGGKVNVSKLGYYANSGPGASGNMNTGASHGGLGAQAGCANYSAWTYGDPVYPELPGSGAWCSGTYSYAQNHYNRGGGAVRIDATGKVEVAGTISADGESSYDAERGATGSERDNAAAGGSVWITCETFVGAGGSVTAKGGDGDISMWPYIFYGTTQYYLSDTRFGQPGGGGRIAIHYDADKQTVKMAEQITISAEAGISIGKDDPLTTATADKYQKQAEPGTVWFTDKKILDATFGKSLSGAVVGFTDYTIPAGFKHTAGHVRFQGEGFQLIAAGDYTITGATARLEVGGICCTNRTAFAEVYAGKSQVSFTVNGSLTVQNGARFDIRAAETNGTGVCGGLVTVAKDFTVEEGGSAYAWCDPVNLGSPRFLVGGDFTVAAGGLVSAEYRGGAGAYASQQYSQDKYGPKAQRYTGFGPGRGIGYTGGSHGGRGAFFTNEGETGGGTVGPAYDDPYRPSLPGSGGNSNGYGDAGSAGGVISIEAQGALTVDGTINADGRFGWHLDYRTGSGSGGTIFLSGRTFAGSGVLSAKGGAAYHMSATKSAAAGGGGRIAVWTGEPWSANLPKRRIVRQENTPPADETFAFTGTATAAGGKGVRSAESALTDDDMPAASCGGDGTVWFCKVNKPTGLVLIFR